MICCLDVYHLQELSLLAGGGGMLRSASLDVGGVAQFASTLSVPPDASWTAGLSTFPAAASMPLSNHILPIRHAPNNRMNLPKACSLVIVHAVLATERSLARYCCQHLTSQDALCVACCTTRLHQICPKVLSKAALQSLQH